MFGFFKKRREKQAARQELNALAEQFMRDAEAGEAKPLEMALVIHEKEPGRESFARILMTLPSAELYILNAGEDRWDDVALMMLEDAPFVALFTSQKLATAAIMPPYDRVQEVSALELLFCGRGGVGWVFNPGNPLLAAVMTEPMLETARKVLTEIDLREGEIHTVWTQGWYRAVRILKTDDVGIHFRLYPAGWKERPASISPTELERGELNAVGHLPFVRKSFLAMGPKKVSGASIPVTEEDLDGYRIWEQDKGGYFGNSD